MDQPLSQTSHSILCPSQTPSVPRYVAEAVLRTPVLPPPIHDRRSADSHPNPRSTSPRASLSLFEPDQLALKDRKERDVPTISSYGFTAALNMLAIVGGGDTGRKKGNEIGKRECTAR